MTALALSVPETWVPALYGQPADGLPACERRAMARWAEDLLREFGPCSNFEVSHARTWDRCHEGTEFGAAPAWCRTVHMMWDTDADADAGVGRR